MERLLEAIQVRKLDRLAAMYAVGAWLVVQAASIALPTFDTPGWILKALILFAILGFPLALVLGWMGARHLPVAHYDDYSLEYAPDELPDCAN